VSDAPVRPPSDAASPAVTGEPSPAETPPKRARIVRWEGLIPLVLVVGLLVLGWRLALPRVLASVASEALTTSLGTQVDVRGVSIGLGDARLTLASVEIADPFDTTRNVLQMGPITLDLLGAAALEKKVVVESLVVADARWSVRRAVPARSVRGASFARTLLGETRRFAQQIAVPPLKLLPLDTVRALVLDPKQLGTVKAAQAVRDSADTLKRRLTDGVQSLRLQETVDSGEALVARLSKASPRSLGLAGTQQAVRDIRAMLRRLDDTKRRVESLATEARAGADSLASGIRRVDDARRADYAFARSLLQLPTFEGPDFSGALFGPVSIARFEQAVYYAKLAERWVPPGLKPREDDGPTRVRLSGTTVHFPKERQFPRLLLKRAEVRLGIADPSGAPSRYRLVVGDVTTEPQLVGRPIVALMRRDAGAASGLASLDVRAVLNHLGPAPHDSVSATAAGIALPSMPLPGLPMRLELGAGTSGLTFVRRGAGMAGRWSLRAPRVTWVIDSAALAGRNRLERVAVDVLRGVPELRLDAEIGGTFEQPRLRVTSNLDQAIAASMRAMLGAEVAKAEARVRAEVDKQVAQARAVAQAKVAEATAQAQAKLDEGRQRLEAARKQLDERLRALTGGLVGVPG
jgi:uncharacterized protein (TIGR03545 family)